MKTLSDVEVSGKKVFLRADLDIPLDDGNAEGVTRLTNIKPTVDYLSDHGVKEIIIAGHIDRPEKPDPALSTKRIIGPLSEILGRPVVFMGDFGEEITEPLTLFENLRF